jgi:hypothetical protein
MIEVCSGKGPPRDDKFHCGANEFAVYMRHFVDGRAEHAQELFAGAGGAHFSRVSLFDGCGRHSHPARPVGELDGQNRAFFGKRQLNKCLQYDKCEGYEQQNGSRRGDDRSHGDGGE